MTAVDRLGRAYEAYRRTAWTRSAIVLLLANLIPLAGVLFFDWSLLTILVLYWLENGIVGLWNIPKIIMAKGSLLPHPQDLPGSAARAASGSTAEPANPPAVPPSSQVSQLLGPRAAARLSAVPRTGLAIFFSFHYGMFWLGHGIFVFSLPAFGGGWAPGDLCFDATGLPVDCGSGAFGELVWPAVIIGAVALFLSHGASFFLNYVGRGEYLTASPTSQMTAVYGRVLVLHLTIIVGSIVVAILGSPIGALLVLVVLKTAFDLNLHLRERRRAEPPLDVLPVPTTASPSSPLSPPGAPPPGAPPPGAPPPAARST